MLTLKSLNANMTSFVFAVERFSFDFISIASTADARFMLK